MVSQPSNASTAEKSSLLQRRIAGILLVGISTIVISGPALVFVFLILINFLVIPESHKLIVLVGSPLQKFAGQVIGVLMMVMIWLVFQQFYKASVILLLLPFISFSFFAALFREKSVPFQNIAPASLGIIWISLSLTHFSGLTFLPFETGPYHATMLLGHGGMLYYFDFLMGTAFFAFAYLLFYA